MMVVSDDSLDISSADDGLTGTETTSTFYDALHSSFESNNRRATLLPPYSTHDTFESEHKPSSNNNFITSSSVLNPTVDPSNSIIEHNITQPSSLPRRRMGTANSKRSVSTSSSTVTVSSSNPSIRQRYNNNNTNASVSDIFDEETEGEEGRHVVGRLRTSLDSGMAALRKWIGSRQSSSVMPEIDDMTTRPPSENIDVFIPSIDNIGCSRNSGSIPVVQDRQGTSSQHTSFPPDLEMNQTMFDDDYDSVRERALSEPDAVRIRALYRRRMPDPSSTTRQRGRTQQQQTHNGSSDSEVSLDTTRIVTSSRLSPSAAEALQASRASQETRRNYEMSQQVDTTNRRSSPTAGIESSISIDSEDDPHRDARNHWIRINRRFQLVFSVFALIFSILLFSIILCWVVLTSAYVVSIEQECDVPLKLFFWLATVQLVMDVFRNDVIRILLCWDTNSPQRMPCRVIIYKALYLLYALLVLRLGVKSVFIESTTCNETAHQLFLTSSIFVSLCIAAWATIILGYLVPFCIVAALLITNGCNRPTSTNRRDNDPGTGPFYICSAAVGAPPGCVDELPVIQLQDFPVDYPMECCICMENFTWSEIIVETSCKHVFHKECCREWLKQSSTCPVCRTYIPAEKGLDNVAGQGGEGTSTGMQRRRTAGMALDQAARSFGRNDLHHEMVSLLQIIRRHERHQRSQGRH